MPRLALVSSYTPSLTNFRGPLIRACVEAGYDVHGYGPEDTPELRQDLEVHGATLQVYPLERSASDPREDIRAFWALYRSFRALKPDVVLSYTIKPNVWASLAAKLAGVPRILSLQTGLGYAFSGESTKARLTGGLLTGLLRAAFAANDRVLVYNQDIEDTFRRRHVFHSERQIERIAGTGIDLKHYTPSPIPAGRPRFILIARLLVDKGIRVYVEAARKVREKHGDIVFDLVGPFDPNPMGLTQNEVDGWRNEGDVRYHGATDDVRPFLRNASVFVLPTWYPEGVPRTILEAMAMGRAVITTDSAGCRDAIEHGRSGLIVPPRDADALAQAMLNLIENPEQISAFGDEAQRRAKEVYDVDLINAQIIRALQG